MANCRSINSPSHHSYQSQWDLINILVTCIVWSILLEYFILSSSTSQRKHSRPLSTASTRCCASVYYYSQTNLTKNCIVPFLLHITQRYSANSPSSESDENWKLFWMFWSMLGWHWTAGYCSGRKSPSSRQICLGPQITLSRRENSYVSCHTAC